MGKDKFRRVTKLLAAEHKLEIVRFLKNKGSRPVGVIADHLKISFKATSKHLLQLSEEGILKRQYNTPFVLYSVSTNLPEPAHSIISNLN